MSDETMTPEERKAARERCEAATDGPWQRVGMSVTRGDDTEDPRRTTLVADCFRQGKVRDAYSLDADFIAHARTDLPKALDTIESLQRRFDGLKKSRAAEVRAKEQWRERAESAAKVIPLEVCGEVDAEDVEMGVRALAESRERKIKEASQQASLYQRIVDEADEQAARWRERAEKAEAERDEVRDTIATTVDALHEDRRKAMNYAEQLGDPELRGKAHGLMYAIELLTADWGEEGTGGE